MLGFANLKNYFLGVTIGSMILGNTFASQAKPAVKASPLPMNYSANSIVKLPNHQGILLKGKADITINHLIHFSADRILINFANNQNVIQELIIFGEGTLKDKKKVTHFKDGIYNLKKAKLTAEKIWH